MVQLVLSAGCRPRDKDLNECRCLSGDGLEIYFNGIFPSDHLSREMSVYMQRRKGPWPK